VSHPTAEPQPGEIYAGHRLGALIGQGGMGAVFAATRVADGAARVVKFLDPELTSDEVLLARFEREWAALKKLPPSPTLVRVHEVLLQGPRPCLVLDLAPGRPLSQILREEGAFPPELVAAVGRDLASALALVHATGVLHRDVKPANALYDPASGRTCLVDFGLAKDTFRTGLTQPGHLLGTALYMAPELWEEEDVDARADVFALGATLFHLLCGRPPFDGEDIDEIADAILDGDPPRVQAARPDTPPELAHAIGQCLLQDPARRYPDMRALAQDFEAILQGGLASVPRLVSGEASLALLPADYFTVGSDPACSIQVAGASPKHGHLRFEGRGFVFSVLPESGPASVGERELRSRRPYRLRHGDTLRLGAGEVRYTDPLRQTPATPSYLRDAARELVPEPALRALARVGDPRAFLYVLEGGAAPALAADLGLLALLGPEAASDLDAGLQAEAQQRRATLDAALGRITQLSLRGTGAWLTWWQQVKSSAPPQLGPHSPLPTFSLLGGARPRELGAEERVVLVGRDVKCTLRLEGEGVARLHWTLLRLHTAWALVPGVPGTGDAAAQAAFWSGQALPVGPHALSLEVKWPSPAEGVSGGVFRALCARSHPSVARELLEFARGADWSAWATRLFPEPGPAREQFAAALAEERTSLQAMARQVLRALLGGEGVEAWAQAIQGRSLGPQLTFRGWREAAPS
jgi:protein kinase-like protein